MAVRTTRRCGNGSSIGMTLNDWRTPDTPQAGAPSSTRYSPAKSPHPPICELIGFAFDEIDDGRVVMTFNPHESQYNPIGTVHGGAISTVLDSVMGGAVHSMLPQLGTFFVHPAHDVGRDGAPAIFPRIANDTSQ
jgi:hypothetical protein